MFTSSDWEHWAEARELLKKEDVRQFDDASFLIWCDVTEQYPQKELKRRSSNSIGGMVEYIRSLVVDEFARQSRLKAKRRLARELKTLKDDITGDIVNIKIGADMNLSELHALQTILFLRLQLAEVADEDKMPVYRSLCKARYEEISNALIAKYKTATTVNDKIEMLECLQDMELFLRNECSDFALEEASVLEDIQGLTFSQKLRLKWLTGIETDDDEATISRLLPEAHNAFDIAALSIIKGFGTDCDRESIFNWLTELLSRALADNDTDELSRLLNVAAYWNIINPLCHSKLSGLLTGIADVKNLSTAEQRLNTIAAKVYSEIDKITGKYDFIDEIPA